MDSFAHKALITSPYSLTYSYYLSPSFNEQITTNPNLPVIMLLHGYPDDAHMWSGSMPHLQSLGYPIFAPDLLGFGGSSKPTDPRRYNYKTQASSLSQILDHESCHGRRIIPVGHDFGSGTAQRFYLYHRDRCIGLCLLSGAYQPPTPHHFSLWTANHETTKRFGYPQWSYWEFFTAPDAPELLRMNLDRFFEVNNGYYPSPLPEENGRDIWMREMFCVKNAMREYITRSGKYANYTVPLKPYPDLESVKRRFIERLSRDGLEGPVNYYISLANNTMLEDERELCEKGPNGEDRRLVDVPVLHVGQTGDWVCRTDLMSNAKGQGLVPDCEEKVIEAGHWCPYEKPKEVAEAVGEWLTRKFPVKS
ncbi:hypothetical protein H2198_001883 [Neophaeococcomyces mojaviensis]|uniref:Uncharacterized protein n=1 Tax=Neophaeococcomyces mojaviensis TaxID=3383035 RepID=A0ACC3AG39_9EURO|nr:hypothetical protein H2198_001883 [Knufia sp. JES_112]